MDIEAQPTESVECEKCKYCSGEGLDLYKSCDCNMFVHPECLNLWIKKRGNAKCEICRKQFEQKNVESVKQESVKPKSFEGLRIFLFIICYLVLPFIGDQRDLTTNVVTSDDLVGCYGTFWYCPIIKFPYATNYGLIFVIIFIYLCSLVAWIALTKITKYHFIGIIGFTMFCQSIGSTLISIKPTQCSYVNNVIYQIELQRYQSLKPVSILTWSVGISSAIIAVIGIVFAGMVVMGIIILCYSMVMVCIECIVAIFRRRH
jgi:hypothetical protein